MPEQRPLRHRFAADCFRNVHAVQRPHGLGGIDSRSLQQRRHEVGEHHRLGAFARGFCDAGPADDQRLAQPAFVKIAFAGAERRVVRRGRAGELQAVQPAVVRCENEDRLLRESERLHLRHQSPHRIVQRLDHRCVFGMIRVLVLRRQLRLCADGDVRIVVRDVAEKRLVLVRLHELLRRSRDCVFAFPALDVRWLCIGWRRHDFIKTLLLRRIPRAAEMPFAKQPRRIARALQQLRDRPFLQRQLALDARLPELLRWRVCAARQEVRDVQSRRAFPRHQRRPRRRANRLRRVGIRKAHAFLREAVEIRRAMILAAVAAQIIHAEVIRENEHNIRFVRCMERESREEKSEEETHPEIMQAGRNKAKRKGDG